MKLLLDMCTMHFDRTNKAAEADSEAWRSLRLRSANNAETADNFLRAGVGITSHFLSSAALQPYNPIRTGAADTQVQVPPGTVYPPIRFADLAGATANAGIFTAMQSLADNVANIANRLSVLEGKGTTKASKAKPRSKPRR